MFSVLLLGFALRMPNWPCYTLLLLLHNEHRFVAQLFCEKHAFYDVLGGLASQNHMFYDVFWRLGTEKHAFSDVSASGVRLCNIAI